MNLFILIFLISFFEIPAIASWEKIEDDNLTTRFGFGAPSLNMELKAPKSLSNDIIKYQPNIPGKFLMGFNYRNFGLTVGAKGPVTEDQLLQKGNTKSTDVQLRFLGKNSLEFYYQQYRGFYIENSDEVDPSYVNSLFKIQRPDIHSKKFGFNYYRNFYENDFSLKVAFDQGGRPKKNASSNFAFASGSKFNVQGDDSFVPGIASANFGSMANFKELELETITLGMAWGGIATLRGFYATLFLGLGVGYQKQQSTLLDLSHVSVSTLGSSNSGRIGFGYNGKNHIVAAQLLIDSVNTHVLEGEVSARTMEIGVTYGYRWDGVNIPFLNAVSKVIQ